MMAKTKSVSINFEESLQELEALVEEMEKGELSLEDSLKHFERGIELTRNCQHALQVAEQKVEKLISQDGNITAVPLDPQG
jgi:exodeoxyribonuclease VII small subunit